MRSLWSGVSGLRVHQVGMDVEGNNIANVNTNGFKYSRVNYSTMFSQTMSIATQPTANLGGRNAKQVGLGVEATATQRIHSQGNMQTTDSNYDVAISGNGFFLVSNDGGKTQYLTRDGAFNQDAAGNFVNSSGYVVQGWVRDPITGRIDTSLPAGNLSWDPSMSLPANPSSEIYLNASLNSGRKISQETSRYIYSLDSVYRYDSIARQEVNENASRAETFYTTSNNAIDVREKAVDFAAVFNSDTYESLNLRNNQSFWLSYADAVFTTNQAGATTYTGAAGQGAGVYTFWGTNSARTILDITINNQSIYSDSINGIDAVVSAINGYSTTTGVEASVSDNRIVLRNRNASGTDDNMKNINLEVGTRNTAGESWTLAFDADGNVQPNGQGSTATAATADNSQWTNRPATQNPAVAAQNRSAVQVITAHRYQYSSSTQNIGEMSNPTAGYPQLDLAGNDINGASTDPATVNYINAITGNLLSNTGPRTFHSTEDLRELMQRDARYGVDYGSDEYGGYGISFDNNNALQGWTINNINEKVTVSVNSTGRYVFGYEDTIDTTIRSIDGGQAGGTVESNAMYIQASSYRNEASQVSSNDALTTIFKGLQGQLDVGNLTKQSASMVLSSYSSNLQVYDSLGTQHLIRVEWTKHETTVDGGNLWQMILRIDEPATFNVVGQARNNIIVGEVRFGNDGSLVSYDPTDITFSGNNGSAPNQLISLNLGASGGFNGLVSNDQTSGISQQETDGYPPGMMLQGMQNKAIDQDGNIIASFSNGIQQIVGKIAMGNVTNEVGLEEIGSNLFRTSANSGSLTVGTSNTGGRGTFKSATLEMSNADLSLALTNLIVIQRGYQANSKTITTSDTMLNTLLQLKQ